MPRLGLGILVRVGHGVRLALGHIPCVWVVRISFFILIVIGQAALSVMTKLILYALSGTFVFVLF